MAWSSPFFIPEKKSLSARKIKFRRLRKQPIDNIYHFRTSIWMDTRTSFFNVPMRIDTRKWFHEGSEDFEFGVSWKDIFAAEQKKFASSACPISIAYVRSLFVLIWGSFCIFTFRLIMPIICTIVAKSPFYLRWPAMKPTKTHHVNVISITS